jgi:hypothetical protein
MKRMAIAVAVPLAAGCANLEWVKPDATPQQAQADSQYCREIAEDEARDAYLDVLAGFGPLPYRAPFGWRPVGYPFYPYDPYYNAFADPLADRMMLESDLENFCMRAKGYRLVRAPKQK